MIIEVSTSSGKDSTATLLLALEKYPKKDVFPVFADTGNEHELVYEYLSYLEKTLDIKIVRLKKDFTEEWWHRRDYVRDKWVEKMVIGRAATEKSEAIQPIPRSEAEAITTRVLAVFEKGPTGNPYLDLCVIKGRFPSRMAQFCTTELKTKLLREYTYGLVEKYGHVESWQGIRAQESVKRSKYPERDREEALYETVRPILNWDIKMVIEQHKKFGVKLNPLYKMGMGRVGCMPCINVGKDELLVISKRFPEQIERIAQWETIVKEGSKRGLATFFAHTEMKDDPTLRPTVYDDVAWSRTKHGGKQLDFTRDEPSVGCVSSLGLCESMASDEELAEMMNL